MFIKKAIDADCRMYAPSKYFKSVHEIINDIPSSTHFIVHRNMKKVAIAGLKQTDMLKTYFVTHVTYKQNIINKKKFDRQLAKHAEQVHPPAPVIDI